MLEKDSLLSSWGRASSPWDSEQLQDVSITSSYAVLFKFEAVLFDDLLESLVKVWVCTGVRSIYDIVILLELLA